MKRIITSLLLTIICSITFAQNASFQKAVSKYKTVVSLTASATKTRHNAAVTKDAVTQGAFYVKKPNKVLITFNNGKDALLMNGTAFTMTINGRKFKTNSTHNPQFKTFQNVLESIFTGGNIDLSKLPDVKITQNSNNVILTITPMMDKKNSKRQLFNSFVVTIDSNTSELRTLRMNEKKGNYTEYKFSEYKFGATVADNMFK